MRVSMSVYAIISEDALGSQKRALDALSVQLRMVVSHLTWILRTKLGSFTRVLYVLNS